MNKKHLHKPEVTNVPDFWTCVSNSKKPFLALDYDGTLAPFQIDRTEARPLPGVAELLRGINDAGKTFLAVISGRPLAEVMSFLASLDITFVGSHGFELKHPRTGIVEKRPALRQSEGLEIARKIASGLELGHLIETKPSCVALHTRALEANQAESVENRVRELWCSIAAFHRLHCRRFNGGIEILAKDWNKGDAVLSLLAQSGADLCVYVGDDTTDEDVFKSLNGRGIGIKVGELGTPTMAHGFLSDCRMVKEFLKTWYSLDSGKDC